MKDWVKSLDPKPAPAPVPTRMTADPAAIIRQVQRLIESLTGRPWIPPGPQLEDWQPFGHDHSPAPFNHPTFPAIDIPTRIPHPLELFAPGRGTGLALPSGATVF